MHRLRVAWTFLRIGLLNELAYRANLYLQVVQSGVAVAGAIGGLLVVFGHTDALRGWGPDEVLAVLGVYLLMGAVMGGVIEPSMQKLMEDVRQGTLDYTLTKPEEAQFLVSVAEIRVWKLVDVALGLAVLAVALARRGASVGPADLALFALMLVAGGAIVYSFLLAMAAASFWFVRIGNILVIFSDLYQAARWPIGIYPGWLRTLLTFVVPVAIAITVPAEALVGRLTGSRVLLAWGVAAGALAALRGSSGCAGCGTTREHRHERRDHAGDGPGTDRIARRRRWGPAGAGAAPAPGARARTGRGAGEGPSVRRLPHRPGSGGGPDRAAAPAGRAGAPGGRAGWRRSAAGSRSIGSATGSGSGGSMPRRARRMKTSAPRFGRPAGMPTAATPST